MMRTLDAEGPALNFADYYELNMAFDLQLS